MIESQVTVIVYENIESSSKTGNISRINFSGPIRLKYSICEAEFERPANSRREVCSFPCKAERSRRYSREYQADGRRMLAEFRHRFGGRHPTEEEIYAILSRRREAR